MKRICFAIITLCLLAFNTSAQVQVSSRIDSLQLVVGEQTGITLEVSCDAKQQVEFPSFKPQQELVPNVEVVRSLKIDTTMLNGGKRVTLSRKYIITAWDSSFYYLPAMEVKVDKKPYQAKALALKVYTLDVDTVHVDRYFGPKGEMKLDFAWEDWHGVLWSFAAILLLVALAAVMIYMLKTGKNIVRIVRRKRKEPAHEVALNEIARIKQERTWAQEDSKQYYTQLTDTLRTYIQDRYGFSAMEMTSDEIIERLTEENNPEALAELTDLFRTADLVKFAKYTTLINENDANLMAALQYVNQTKQEVDPNQPAEEEVVTPEDKRRKQTTWAMRIVATVSVAVSFVLLCWIVWRIIDLLR